MPALLAEAERSGGMTIALRRRIAQMIETLLPQFDAVLITCSTLGPVAGDFSAQDRVMRTDGMLAEALQRQAGRTVALCAAESTLAATRALFSQPGSQVEVVLVEVVLVEGAWAAFKAGETTRYFALIAAAAEQAYQQGAVAVALAQSSMTPVAQQFPDTQRPLTGPHLALQACYELR
ncbi:glutamate racemase [Pantoea agglomerans]|uniref:glutamate racemase n=1 Tax=Enterobacter agglomerans TaxID=549 RepID=UPI0016547F3C|nr:glutamate racemase [Pantoea agglomerans]